MDRILAPCSIPPQPIRAPARLTTPSPLAFCPTPAASAVELSYLDGSEGIPAAPRCGPRSCSGAKTGLCCSRSQWSQAL